MSEQDPSSSPAASNAQDKHKREIEDVRQIFAALLADEQLLSDENRIYTYLTPDLTQIQNSFGSQHAKLGEIFPLLLEPGAPVRIGGSGVVIRCANAKQATLKYALKIPRPSLFEGQTSEDYREVIQEYFRHAPLSHENIVRLLAPVKIEIPHAGKPSTNYGAILMEWIEGAKPLNSYLVEDTHDYREVVELLAQAFRGLAYLHSMYLIHWDIKSDNLLVSASGTVKLTDIGNARRMDDPSRGLVARSTRGNPPDELETVATNGARAGWFTSRRTSVRLPDLSWDCAWLDLWMFARELNRLFKAEESLFEKDSYNSPQTVDNYKSRAATFQEKLFSIQDDNASFARSFLRLLIERLLFPRTPGAPKCYETAESVIQALSRLLPEFGGAQSLPELQAIPQRVLRLPRTGNAPWTRRIGRVFNLSTLQRLRRHRQLGGVLQVYPGATHTRLEHAAGVLSAASQYVRALYADRTDPFWRLTMGTREIDALLMAALLHDIGHIAFGHFIEEMHGLIEGYSHEDYAILVLDPHRSEEVRFGDANKKAASTDRAELDSFLQYLASILRPLPTTCVCTHRDNKLLPAGSDQIKLEILHSIMDSAIDADKIDYLLRDAHHCGVHYAEGIDVDRFFQSLTAIPFLDKTVATQRLYGETNGDSSEESIARASIGVTDKGVLPVESMLVARYQMFSCVYWHHTTRAQTVMLQFLVLAYLEGGESELEVEQRLDDLLKHFRMASDEEALLWLRTQLRKQDGLEREKRRLFENIADGVLGRDRGLLYWKAFELRYERGARGAARQIYEGLMLTSEKAARQTKLTAYIEFAKDIRYKFGRLFVKKLSRLVVNFSDGEILIDIPPSGKDQVDNVFVQEDDKVRRVQDLSPLADAVSAAFRYWVRRPRVFLAPTAWKKCSEAMLGETEVWNACFEALVEMFVAQSRLFPDTSTLPRG